MIGEDIVLDGLDISGDLHVDQSVFVDDPVEDGVQGGHRTPGEQFGLALELLPDAGQRRRLATTDGEEESITDDDDELTRLDVGGGLDVAQGSEDDQGDIVAITLELDALAAGDGILDGERVQTELFVDVVELLGGGILQAHPQEIAGLTGVGQFAELITEVPAGLPNAAAVESLVHDHCAIVAPNRLCDMATVLLIRHGQSSANVAGVLAGWAPDVALTEKGRDQASTLAPVIEAIGPARIVSSPVQRCLETATLLAGALEVQQDDSLGECHYGAWTGRPLADLAKDPLWRIIQDAPETPEATFPPSEGYPGESLTQMTARLAAGLSHLDDAVSHDHGPDAVWVLVSHGDPIKALLAAASGAGVAGLQRFHVDPGSVSVIRRHGEGDRSRQLILGSNLNAAALQPLVEGLRRRPPEVDPADAVVGGGAG